MRWLLLLTLLPGCSFAFIHGPPEHHEKLQYFDCDSGGGAMAADISGVAWSGLTTVALASRGDESGEAQSDSATVAFGAITAIYLASAIYGGVNRSRCNRAKEELAVRISRDYEQYRQRLKELEQQVQQSPAPSGCFNDLDCKGERICVAAQCVDPPIPPGDSSPNDTTPAPAPVQSGPEAPDPAPPPDSPEPLPNPPGNPGSFPPAPRTP